MPTEYCPKCGHDLFCEIQGQPNLLRCLECNHTFPKEKQELFVAPPGFCNTSSAAHRIGGNVRDLWRYSSDLGIVPGYERHRAVWTNEEIDRIQSSIEQHRNAPEVVLISGQVVCTTETITKSVDVSRRGVNEWARRHPDSTVNISGERMILVGNYLEHLNSRQQILDAERLRSNTQQ